MNSTTPDIYHAIGMMAGLLSTAEWFISSDQTTNALTPPRFHYHAAMISLFFTMFKMRVNYHTKSQS